MMPTGMPNWRLPALQQAIRADRLRSLAALIADKDFRAADRVGINYAQARCLLFYLQERGQMFIGPNIRVYAGMVVGIHARDNDLVVNATRTKQLTNFRVSGKEDAIKITPPIELTLEYGVEFIEDDELVEITPDAIRLRKKILSCNQRPKRSDN